MALPTTAIILGMRYDMAAILVRTYDFWYQVLLSLVGSVAFAVGTRDMRGVCGFAIVAISVIVILADANFKAARFFFATSLIACGLCAVSALFLMFGSIDKGHSRVFFEVDGHALPAASAIADVFLVFLVIHARNAYV